MARLLRDDALLGVLDRSAQLTPSSTAHSFAYVPKKLEDQNDHRKR
jgi:hypothetical protein